MKSIVHVALRDIYGHQLTTIKIAREYQEALVALSPVPLDDAAGGITVKDKLDFQARMIAQLQKDNERPVKAVRENIKFSEAILKSEHTKGKAGLFVGLRHANRNVKQALAQYEEKEKGDQNEQFRDEGPEDEGDK